jgi:bleomycin hydrolase
MPVSRFSFFLVLGLGLALAGPTLARSQAISRRILRLDAEQKAALPPEELRRAVQKFGLKAMALRPEFRKEHTRDYAVTVPDDAHFAVKDQDGSGDCWIFATGRVLRAKLRNRGCKAVPLLSPAFVNYHTLRSKAYGLLEQAATADVSQDVELAQVRKHLDEGGEHFLVMDVLRRHGFVPEQVMPLTADRRDPALYIGQLQALVARGLRDLRLMPHDTERARQRQKKIVRSYKRQVDKLLALTVGAPPKSFEFHGQRYTPKGYARRGLALLGRDLDYVTLSHDPTLNFGRRHAVGTDPGLPSGVDYNVNMELLQQAIRAALDSGEPVYFATNIDGGNPYHAEGAQLPTWANGLLSKAAFDYALFGLADTMTKHDRLRAKLFESNHAMAFTGYDSAATPGTVRKWKVENSHGKDAGDGGFLHMYDDYFRSYVTEAAVPRWAVPTELLRRLEARPVVKAR